MNSTELAAAAGISYRQLDYWIRKGWLDGSMPGSGRSRSFDDDDLERVALMGQLVNAGFPPDRAAGLSGVMLRNGGAELAPGLWLVREKAPARSPQNAGADSTVTTPRDGGVKYGGPTSRTGSEITTTETLASPQLPRVPQTLPDPGHWPPVSVVALPSEGRSPSHPPQSQNPPSQPAQTAGHDGSLHPPKARSTHLHRGT